MIKRILLAGETFIVTQSVAIGNDVLTSSSRSNGARIFKHAIETSPYELEQLASESCETDFPRSTSALDRYSAVVLSDIGALSLLLTPESRSGKISVNRLVMLNDWIKSGGSLMMAGGYNSFQGMSGSARYHGTPLEECLPVNCLPHSDGLEAPEGLSTVILQNHPIIEGLPQLLPPILGMNKTVLKPDDQSSAILNVAYRGVSHPLLAIRENGKGRTLAWMTDIGPHWMSQDFVNSPVYAPLMRNMMAWLCNDL